VPLFLFWDTDAAGRIISGGFPVIAGLAELAIIVYGAAMVVFFYVLNRLDVTQAILGTYLLPFFIALIGVVLFQESITPAMIAGGLLILAGTLTITIYEEQILKWLERKRAPVSTSSSRSPDSRCPR
jgi:drug/metabolite transporter (DMT)-like permease